ncbi:MAG: phosphate-starvation-inducible PsiE family protein [Gammaproteobacteria bacterium]|nr:phosphate-starvation-inducible PsiE family protein [Gammaproteobacteria bacterium]
MISKRFMNAFDSVVDVVFSLILIFIMLGIAIGAVQLVFSIWELFKFEGITGHYIDVITDVLTLYVLVELSRSLVEYFNCHRLRLTFIVDAAIVFIIREILILLFKHETSADMLYAFSALLLVLGVIRFSSVIAYQYEKRIATENPQPCQGND